MKKVFATCAVLLSLAGPAFAQGPTLCSVTTAAPTYGDGQTRPLSCDTSGRLRTLNGAPAVVPGAPVNSLQYNNAGAFGGISGVTTNGTGLIVTANGALSSGTGPALSGVGTWITGGTATTTKPYILIEPTGTTSNGWNTNGTGIGVNSAAGFTGNLIDLMVASSRQFAVSNIGNIQFGGSTINGLAASSQFGNTNGSNIFFDATHAGVRSPNDAYLIIDTGNAHTADAIYFGAKNAAFASITELGRITELGSWVMGTAAIATSATDGFFYAISGAGPPTGTPTTFTGRVPMYVDSTNSQLYMYIGAWKQPKTPAGAATVTWQ